MTVTPGKIDTSPTTAVLRSRPHKDMLWHECLAELIDNAFDANASLVSISIKGKELIVQDDGVGIADIARAVREGEHAPSEYTTVGMYGVGMKHAWQWAGSRLTIDTIHKGFRSVLVDDMEDKQRNKTWEIDAPIVTESSDPSRTTLTIRLHKERRSPSVQTVSNLEWLFAPAILSGKRIELSSGRANKRILTAMQMPPLQKTVAEEFFINGRHVSLVAGVTQEGQAIFRGPIWVQYGHRNIIGDAIGCKGYTAKRIGGIIKLGKGWSLTEHKNDVTDFRNELNEEVFARIEPLLIEADAAAEQFRNDLLQHGVEGAITAAVHEMNKRHKEKRPNRTGHQGTALPGSTGRKREKAAAKDASKPGSVIPDEKENATKDPSVFLVYGDVVPSESIGFYSDASKRLTLNQKHPFVNAARIASDTIGTTSMVCAIIANYVVTHRGSQQLLTFDATDFTETYGRMLEVAREALGNGQ